ncbi:MAG TPA: hypothetical protein VMU28_12025 [Terriglobales bacterium]|nr:hypothetical protein [Terriglobales bacterium]
MIAARKGKYLFAALLLLIAMQAVAQEKMSAVQANPAFDKIKALSGEWEGTFNEAGQTFPSVVKIVIVSDGSAVMHDLAPGTSHEMITMFHPDGANLLATHYCARHNQPRMKLVPSSDPNVLLFEFMDGTNIGPGDAHMQSVKITIVDADHHYEDWSDLDHGKSTTAHFEFHRKKA